VKLDIRDRDQLLHILIQTRRLAKIALSLNAISGHEQNLILQEVQQASNILRKSPGPTQEVMD